MSAKSVEFHADALNPETLWKLADDVRRFERVLVEIENCFAFRADEVMMWFSHGVHTERTVMQAELAQNTAFDEGVQCLVDGRQRNAWYLLAHNGVYLFRAGMAGRRHQRFVDDGALMGDGQTVAAAQFAKLELRRRLLHPLGSMREAL